MNAAHVLNQRIAKSFCFRPLTDVLVRKSNAPPGGLILGQIPHCAELTSKKTKIQELRLREMLLIEFLRGKHNQRNPEDIEAEELNELAANLSLVYMRSEKTAKTLNLQVLEVCFQVLIDI